MKVIRSPYGVTITLSPADAEDIEMALFVSKPTRRTEALAAAVLADKLHLALGTSADRIRRSLPCD
jgi:hypothetical protein